MMNYYENGGLDPNRRNLTHAAMRGPVSSLLFPLAKGRIRGIFYSWMPDQVRHGEKVPGVTKYNFVIASA
jgi:hypothetical protein